MSFLKNAIRRCPAIVSESEPGEGQETAFAVRQGPKTESDCHFRKKEASQSVRVRLACFIYEDATWGMMAASVTGFHMP